MIPIEYIEDYATMFKSRGSGTKLRVSLDTVIDLYQLYGSLLNQPNYRAKTLQTLRFGNNFVLDTCWPYRDVTTEPDPGLFKVV